jgi:uncharacterized protein YbjQ (UPF0145 family)
VKTKEIAKSYGLDQASFELWLKGSGYTHKYGSNWVGGVGSMTVPDSVNMDEMVGAYRQFVAEEQLRQDELQSRRAEEQAAARREAQLKQQALSNMLVTSGFNFDGYVITKYSGYISGDDAVSMDRPSHGFWGNVNGNVGGDLLQALVHIRRNALAELKEAAYALGCNAVIGVDFDYLTLDPETATNNGGTLYLPFLFAVTANGNAVVIEKSS